MKTREQELEQALRGILDAYASRYEPSFLTGESAELAYNIRVKHAINEAKRVLAGEREEVKTFGKRREGMDRSEIDHPGLGG
jgi:hypothetical protein